MEFIYLILGIASHFFIGFAPVESPQDTICVFIENIGGGGTFAAPIAGQILRKYFADNPVEIVGPENTNAAGSL